MVNIILNISIILIIFSCIIYFVLIIIGRNKIISKDNSFDIIKQMIDEYNTINIIESKSYITEYNMKRKVIKLSTRCYYGDDLSSISLALIEAGISVIDDKKNRYIDIFRKIVVNLKTLYIFPILSLLISSVSYNISDAKVSIIIIGLITLIMYMLIDIKNQVKVWIYNNVSNIDVVDNVNRNKILSFINYIFFIDKIIFFSEVLMIIRLILILMNIK